MAKMSHSLQGVYAPLPQSLSDSDSEKEILMEPICNNHTPMNFESKNGHSIQEHDSVKIKRGLSKMSTLRKTAFIFSICMCFLPILFLWVLPCSELVTCPVKVANWEYQQDNIELKGPINLVKGLFKANLNLAVLFKASYSYNFKAFLKYGIMSFMGNNGIVAWDLQQDVEPLVMNCSKIDVDNNGNFECLVVDKKGLKAVETISGQILWYAHSANEKIISELEMPVVLPDFNSDGIRELLSVFKKKTLLLICGRSGKALSKIIPPTNCDTVADLTAYKKEIVYSCKNSTNNISTSYCVRISDLKKFYQNPKYKITVIKQLTVIKDDKYTIGERKLIVSNGANCPNCVSSIRLLNDTSTIKTWSYSNAFIMNPVPFSFKPTKENLLSLRGHVNGFIIKIWQWMEHYTQIRPSVKVFKRAVPSHSGNDTAFVYEVMERVMLITFNQTDVHEINASLSEIKQICYTREEFNCQPDFRNQMDSYLIADLDWDGCQELISYYSTYVQRDDGWHLVSYLKVLRLEEELPKLYSTK